MIGFREFFAHLNDGATPYPWQQRFAERCAGSTPPSLVRAPTGAGKTVVVDALLWALATQVNRPAAERTVGVRTVWAIDRRILVDEVHEHARALAEALVEACEAPEHPLHEIARDLAELSGHVPLVATRWRGGIRADRDLFGPMQPQIITTTVAQVGSRLLFRGYGVAQGSLALQAGLLGCDTNVCLDEAHLAEPFSQTVTAIVEHRRFAESDFRLPGLNAITLTATPSSAAEDAINLTIEDERALGSRLSGEKWATLDDSGATEGERTRALVELTSGYVDDGAPTVACVTNTVKQARAVFDGLSKRFGPADATCLLLIGPQRQADREAILQRAKPLFDGEPPARPLICVATQTFEVGLDADVAALVTESASAAALVQRLGRLNRRGQAVGRATVVRDEGSWLYDEDEALAWNWLLARRREDGCIDVSVSALERDDSRPDPLQVPSAPALTADVVDVLVQTAPLPGAYQDPDVEPFLRGAESETSLDIAMCWRCDLRVADADEEGDRRRQMLLELMPPGPNETLTLSARSARALLASVYPTASISRSAAGKAALAEADIEGDAPSGEIPEARPGDEAARPFVVIRRDEILPGTLGIQMAGRVRPSELQPGDVVVLPTTAGGVDEYGLAPGVRSAASDVAVDLRPHDPDGDPGVARGSASIRISPEVLKAAGEAVPSDAWTRIATMCRTTERAAKAGDTSAVAGLVGQLVEMCPKYDALKCLLTISDESTLAIRSVGPPSIHDLTEETSVDHEGAPDDQADADADADSDAASARPAQAGTTWVLVATSQRRRDEGDRTSSDPPPTLEEHAEAVRRRAKCFAAAAGLPAMVVGAIELAARAHDHGKADPRIQTFFRRGVEPIGEPLLAKSVFGTRDPRTSRLAADLAGLPRRLHHEVASVAVLADALNRNPALGDGFDEKLALYLVATHHGRGRPIPAVPLGGATERAFHVDAAEVAGTARGDGVENWMSGEDLRRFWSVIERYGSWGTAYLESLLMLADRTVSSEGG